MIDIDCWRTVEQTFSVIDHTKRPHERGGDAFGELHVLLFGDFKQLPPATSKPPFIVSETVYNIFEFRVLRENRRVTVDAERATESEEFHAVLNDVALGQASERVKHFVVEAYVRGATDGCAEKTDFEGSTSVFTKRRYRDRWNRTVVRRIAKTRNHSLKVKGRVRHRGARGGGWFKEQKVALVRRKSRTQSLFNLHIAGDWHPEHETATHANRPHMMRTMLVSNLAVQERFANGTQGRLMYWHPESCKKGKSLVSNHPELLARFVKDSALNKREMLPGFRANPICANQHVAPNANVNTRAAKWQRSPDLDHVDVQARQETLTACHGQPVLVQLPLVPSYALTVLDD